MPAAALTRAPLQAAADWHVRLGAGGNAADQAAWQAWHDAAPEHRDAWERVERLKDLLAQAPQRSTQVLQQAGRARQPSRRGLLAGLGVLAVGAIAYQLMPPHMPATDWVATGAGEPREITLPGGGRLVLAPSSRVGLQDGRDERTLRLAQGAVQVITGQDKPLRVLTRDGSIRPLGTRFTVTQTPQDTLVVVQQHAVEVRPGDAGTAVRVAAGQRLRFTAAGAAAVAPVDGSEDAWTRGVLLAMDQPLGELLQGLQQLSGVTLTCDAAVAGLRVSGSFLAGDPQRSLATLADLHRLRLQPRGRGWHLAER